MKSVKIGVLYSFIATFLWSGAFVIARLAVGQISPMTLGASRWFITLLALSVFALPTLKKEWPVAKKFIPQLLVASLTGVTLYAPLSYFAAATTTAINLALISVMTPVFVIFILAFKKEKQSRNTWLGCMVALLGSVYLITNGQISRLVNLEFAQGDLLMLIGTIGFAFYGIALRNVPKGLSQSSILTLMSTFGLIFMLPVLIWEWNSPEFVFNINGTVIFSILFTGLGCSLAAWWTWNLGLEYAGPVIANIVHYALPILSGILGYIFLAEKIGVIHLVSSAIIIFGIYLSTVQPKNVKKD